MKVLKRDGRIVDFKAEHIINAINKAMAETLLGVDEAISHRIAEYISAEVKKDGGLKSVEQIQDLVEEQLMASDRKEAAKKYILYRKQRNLTRPIRSQYKAFIR